MHTMTGRAWAGIAATVITVSALTAGVTTAVASHQFNDISTGSFFHDEIAAIADAGCASGFPDGTFKQNNPTTRGQFTYWLNNCGGRVAFGNDGARTLTSNTEQTLATADMTAGALPTGGGFVVAIGSMHATSTDCASSCVIEFRLRRGPSIVDTTSITVTDSAPASGSIQTVFPVTGGSDTTMRLAAAGNLGGMENVSAEASLTLLYVPFAGDGSGGGQEAAGG